jgi:hypothetical protein
MPPDAFIPSVVATLDAGADEHFSIKRTPAGALSEFPALINGVFEQVTAQYSRGRILTGLSVGTGDDAATVAFLSFQDGLPLIARIDTEGAVYFAAFRYAGKQILELWSTQAASKSDKADNTDAKLPEGLKETQVKDDSAENEAAFAAVMNFRDNSFRQLISLSTNSDGHSVEETYSYDSGGNITEIRGKDYDWNAVYQNGRPVSWTGPAETLKDDKTDKDKAASPATDQDATQPATRDNADKEASPPASVRYVLQWDERGFLVREKTDKNNTIFSYHADKNGVWYERNASPVKLALGVVYAGQASVIKRALGKETSHDK